MRTSLCILISQNETACTEAAVARLTVDVVARAREWMHRALAAGLDLDVDSEGYLSECFWSASEGPDGCMMAQTAQPQGLVVRMVVPMG